MRHLTLCFVAVLVSGTGLPAFASAEPAKFNESEIRTALSELGKHLESPGPAWVYDYTEDAVFVGSRGPAVQGRAALLELAGKMKPLVGFKITPLRIEGNANLAYAYVRASWPGDPASADAKTATVRSLLVFRKDADGKWRVTQELLHPDPEAK